MQQRRRALPIGSQTTAVPVAHQTECVGKNKKISPQQLLVNGFRGILLSDSTRGSDPRPWLVLTQALVRLGEQLGRVKREAAEQLAALVARQEAVEANAPILAEAVAAARQQLRDLAISESVYEEIRLVVPPSLLPP